VELAVLLKTHPLPADLSRKSLYGYRMEVYDVENLEGLARQIVENKSRAKGWALPDDDFKDAVQQMVTEALDIAANKFDPDKNDSYRGYASWLLGKRLMDWYSNTYKKRRHVKATEREEGELDRDVSLYSTVDGVETSLADALVDAEDWVTSADSRLSAAASVFTGLTDELAWAVTHIATPIAEEGLSQQEVARRIGKTRRYVERMMDELRAELALRVGLPSVQLVGDVDLAEVA
jgi:hypothetical protein